MREEFFQIPPKPRETTLTVLITGGSQGSRTLNQAARQSWPLFRRSGLPVRFLHQTGRDVHEELRAEFAETGLEGEVMPFIADMPAAFAQADLIVCRSGAGAVAELAAAGKPSVLVPFPFAADDHQLRNARGVRAGRRRAPGGRQRDERREAVRGDRGAGRGRLRGRLEKMGAAAKTVRSPGAARARG